MPMPKRREILERATELFMKEQARHEGLGYNTPEEIELKEGGYWQQAIEELMSPDTVVIEEKEDKKFFIWAEEQWAQLDADQDREMMRVCSAQNMDFLNCLVLSFNMRHYGLAVKILKAQYKQNMMPRTRKILKHGTAKVRVLWFIGSKEKTNEILETLREKHNITPRVLRDSYLRRDQAHYANGGIYHCSQKQFKELQAKQSVVLLEEEHKKIIAKSR